MKTCQKLCSPEGEASDSFMKGAGIGYNYQIPKLFNEDVIINENTQYLKKIRKIRAIFIKSDR